MRPVLPFNGWIGRFAGQPVIPSFYWNIYSYEQRIKEICIRLNRVIKYADYLGAHVNELIDLVNNLTAKVDELNKQVIDLNERLEDEIKRAQEAEKQLQENIDAEAEARKEADEQLQANIDAETEARKEADEQLQANIDAEQERAEQAEQQLQDNIDAEKERAEQAEQQLQDNIDAEKERAEQAEQQLQNGLNQEIQDRKDGDNKLQSQIDALNSASDVVDVVGTKANLDSYETSKLTDNDIIKVLNDETQNGAQTYYRWSTTSQTWSLIGEIGPYYTKSESDGKYATITDFNGLSGKVTTIEGNITTINGNITNLGDRITTETNDRTEADQNLQEQIDALKAGELDVEHENLYTTGSDKVAGVDAIQNSTDGVISATNKLLTQQSLAGISRAQTGTYLSHSQAQNEDFPSIASTTTDPTYRNGIQVTEYTTTSFIIVNEGESGRWAYYRNSGNTGWERAYQITEDMQSVIDQLTYYRYKSYMCNNVQFDFTRSGNSVAVRISKKGNQTYNTFQGSVFGESVQLDDDFVPELRTVVNEARCYDGYRYTWQQACVPIRFVIQPKNYTGGSQWIGKLQVGCAYGAPTDTKPNPAMEFSGYFTYIIN